METPVLIIDCGQPLPFVFRGEAFPPPYVEWIQWLTGTEDVLFPIQSSGSTGPPQFHSFSRQAVMRAAGRSVHALRMQPHQLWILFLPPSSVGALMLIARSLKAKCSLAYMKPALCPTFAPPPAFSSFGLALTPAQFQAMEADKNGRLWLESAHDLLIGGGALSEYLIRFAQTLNAQVYHSYGMTETLSHVALKDLKKSTVFKPLSPEIRIYPGENHEIIIQDSLFNQDQPIRTRDIALWDENGGFSPTGRLDNIINMGGLKINPEVVEKFFEPYLASRSFYIAGKAHPSLGQIPWLYIEGEPGHENEETELLSVLSSRDRPRGLSYIRHFPRTFTGKIIRKSPED